MVSAGPPSNPISKHGSTASLLSRQYSNGNFMSAQQQPPYHHTQKPSIPHTMPNSPPSETCSPEYVMPKLDRRRTLENFVAPALDAGCSIVTDDNADLDDLDIVYMRRPSTLGLDMALGRTKSNSSATITAPQSFSGSRSGSFTSQAPALGLSRTYSNSNSHANNTNNNAGSNQPSSQQDAKTLRFYSYADMLSDEMASSSPTMKNFRRPSLSHSSSFSYLKPNQSKPTLTTNFSNPFIKKRDSISGPTSASSSNLARHYSNTMLSRSPTNQPSTQQQQRARCCCTKEGKEDLKCENNDTNTNQHTKLRASQRLGKSKFHLESSGSDEFSTDDEDENSNPLSSTSPNVISPSTFLGPRVSRSSTQTSINSSSPLYASARTYSNSGANPVSPSIIRRRESSSVFQQPSINNVLMYDDTLQTEKVGEALRKRISNR